MDRVKAARWTFRGIAAICFAVAVASIAFTALGGMLELIGGVITGAFYGAIGYGLWRMKEGVWIFVLIVLAMFTAVEVALALGRGDWILLLGASINAGIIAALIWAGRQLPEPQGSSSAALESPA